MNLKISNKILFYAVAIIKLFLFLIAILLIFLVMIQIASGKPAREGYIHLRFLTFLFIGILLLITRFISPFYFECILKQNEIRIRFFNPERRNTLQFLFVMFSLGNLKEHILNRKSYNGYVLKIGKLGFKKQLILKMINEGKIYDSKPINISFLGIRKYTELILALDRLKEKINLN